MTVIRMHNIMTMTSAITSHAHTGNVGVHERLNQLSESELGLAVFGVGACTAWCKR